MYEGSADNQPQHKKKRFRKPRSRFTFIWIIGLLVIALSLLTDPDTGIIRQLPFGAGTVATLVVLARGFIYATALHICRKGLLDYFDAEVAWNKAQQTSEGAGLYMIGVGIYCLAIAAVIWAAVSK